MFARNLTALLSILVFYAFPAFAQTSGTPAPSEFVTIVSLADQAPLVARVTVKNTAQVKPERAPGLKIGQARLYVEAEVTSLIRGQAGIAKAIRYLVDVSIDGRGKVPKIKKQQFLVFARQDSSRPGEIQLISNNAHLPWNAALESQVRQLLNAIVAPDAPPRITGIREALHVRGNLQGEGETQIFLATQTNDPVSITVLRRPGLAPRWAVSLTEIVDEAAAPPRRDTLLWYRLACFLPRDIPQSALVSDSPADNDLAVRDYNYVRDQLGPCSN